MLLYTVALDCTICENHFHCYISLLVSFVLFGYGMNFCKVKFLWSKVLLQFYVSDYGLVTVA